MWERRKEERFEIKSRVNAQANSGGLEATADMRIKNISSSGACLETDNNLSEGTSLRLEIVDCPASLVSDLGFWIKLQKQQVNLFAKGKVLRHNPGEIGIEFTDSPNVLNS